MKYKQPKMKVLLTKEGYIFDIVCDFPNSNFNPKEFVGENWFVTFVEKNDRSMVFKHFKHLSKKLKREKFVVFAHDVMCVNDSHRFICFVLTNRTIDGITYIFAQGCEYSDLSNREINYLYKKNAIASRIKFP